MKHQVRNASDDRGLRLDHGASHLAHKQPLKSATAQCDNEASFEDALHQPQPSPRLAHSRVADVAAEYCVPYRRGQMPRRLSERSYVRRVDAPSDDLRGFGLVGVQAGIIRPSLDM